jgi:hypothetical protein
MKDGGCTGSENGKARRANTIVVCSSAAANFGFDMG